MTSIYKITILNHKGAFFISYHNGYMKELLLEFAVPLIPDTFNMAMDEFPYEEELIATRNAAFMKFEPLVPRSVQEKVVMFKMSYRTHFKVPYQAGKAEKANLKGVQVTLELLTTYFTNTEFPLSVGKSMADYTKHFNYVRQITTHGKPVKNSMPNVYDREYEKKLEPGALSEYWKHLRALGWTKTEGVWQRS